MIENFPYKTSRDYDRLLALLDAGHMVVCIADYQFSNEITTRDICRGRKIGEGDEARYSFSARGIGYADVWPDLDDDFARTCQCANIEFIDPMAEQEIREAAPGTECPAVNLDVLNYRAAAVEAFRYVCPFRLHIFCQRQFFSSMCDMKNDCKEKCEPGCGYVKLFTHCLGDLIRKMND